MRAAQRILQEVLQEIQGLDRRHQRSLSEAVFSLFRCQRLQLTMLGRFSTRAAQGKHRIKAMDRLLGNPRLQQQVPLFSRYLAQRWLAGCRQVVVLVDSTEMVAAPNVLSAAVAIGGRALPLVHYCYHNKRLRRRQLRGFLDRLQAVLPPDCVPILITDAGFQGGWLAEVQARGWQYVARLRHCTCVRKEGHASWLRNKTLHSQASRTPQSLGWWSLGKESVAHRQRVHLVLAQRLRKRRTRRGQRGKRLVGGNNLRIAGRQREPWLLATNRYDSAAQVVALYAQRMQIEQTFRDHKSWRFGWSLRYVQCRSVQRMQVLLLIATLAWVLSVLVGLAAQAHQVQRQLQANTTTTRNVLSVVMLGRFVLNQLCDYQPTAKHLHKAWQTLQSRMTV